MVLPPSLAYFSYNTQARDSNNLSSEQSAVKILQGKGIRKPWTIWQSAAEAGFFQFKFFSCSQSYLILTFPVHNEAFEANDDDIRPAGNQSRRDFKRTGIGSAPLNWPVCFFINIRYDIQNRYLHMPYLSNSVNDPIPSWTQWMTRYLHELSEGPDTFMNSVNDPIPSWTQRMTRYLHELQVLVPVLELSPLQRLHMEVGTLDLLLKPPSCKINRFKSAVEENSSQFFIFEKGDKTPANLFRLSHVTVWLSCTSTWGWPAPL